VWRTGRSDTTSILISKRCRGGRQKFVASKQHQGVDGRAVARALSWEQAGRGGVREGRFEKRSS